MTIKNFENKYGVHFTLNHTGKMNGMASLSTSVILNENCKRRAEIPGSICSKCYSARMHGMYKGLADCTAQNTEVLTKTIIPVLEWPILNYAYFRFEAFGDLNNETQVINYFNLCKRNPHTNFALWTKNPVFIKRAITSGYKKPKNIIIIYSSPMINANINSDNLLKAFPFIDKVFTVYDKTAIRENRIDVNCGARNCLECRKCYTKNKVFNIREQLK